VTEGTAAPAPAALAELTTLELGGMARRLVRAAEPGEVLAALADARRRGEPLVVLGGGSNVVVADAGFPGTVLQPALLGRRLERRGEQQLVTVGAGEPWSAVVDWAVAEGLAGIECLAGIPGWVGGAPVQNIGAYGQEVAGTIVSVQVVDRGDGQQPPRVRELAPAELGLRYRDSRLRRERDRYVVLAVTFALTRGGAPCVRYAELERALSGGGERVGGRAADESLSLARAGALRGAPAGTPGGEGVTLAAVREAVLGLRRKKSMVLEPGSSDPNRRSAGSFFTNVVVSSAVADGIERRARALGVLAAEEVMPRFVAGEGVKVPAAWLIERAGFARGLRRGAVGISSRHALALVHHGGGTTAELLALADEIAEGVAARFGVELVPEPLWIGPPGEEPALFRRQRLAAGAPGPAGVGMGGG
jgi:UDP-N-acetylmuramate dehydrogenase